jgi:hypothetical protein
MRYAEGPSTSASVWIDAPPAVVWTYVSDIELPARFSTEFRGASWISDDQFVGRNEHPAAGAWETVSTVQRVPGELWEWKVGDVASPSATWRFTLTPVRGGTELTQWMQMGPARSGLNAAIDAMPDKEERIVERRLAEHQANMQATLEGIKGLAEGAAPSSTPSSPARPE